MAHTLALGAGEPSGDLLGGLLLQGLKAALPAETRYFGVAGPKMQAAGCVSGWPIDTLSVNGYVEVLPKIPKILRLRRELIATLKADPPLAYVGIDAPDFNLGVELALREAGIPTIHFVSPSIWAWRMGRIDKIGRAAGHVLCLFPFEPELYARKGIPATYVGHPLADVIPLVPDPLAAKARLGLPADARVVAILPGSRGSEVARLGTLFVDAATLLAARHPDLHWVIPAATPALKAQLDALLAQKGLANVTLTDGGSHAALEAADAVLLASGTATLEAALYKKPMVISYKVPWLTGQIMKRQGYLPYVGLPNILSERFVVPELLQDAATPQALADALEFQLFDDANRAQLMQVFTALHQTLQRDTATIAARVVVDELARAGRL